MTSTPVLAPHASHPSSPSTSAATSELPAPYSASLTAPISSNLQSTLWASLYPPATIELLSASSFAWRFEAWLFTYPLTSFTVLDYFKHSPYYDLNCNNERVLLAQQAPSAQSMAAASQSDSYAQRLRRLQGIEYEVESAPLSAAGNQMPATDGYYLIRKQQRHSPSSVSLLALYYVIGVEPGAPHAMEAVGSSTPLQRVSTAFHSVLPRGTVIPMPTVSHVLRTALSSAMTNFSISMDHFDAWMRCKQDEISSRSSALSTTNDAGLSTEPTAVA